jgi:argininosuccinate lyase
MKLWGGRFQKGPSEVFERFSNSLDFDRRLIDADIRGSIAFAGALERVGILTAFERGQLAEAFARIQEDSRRPDFYAGATDEDVHTLVIRKLQEAVGGLADKIHTGRSRNEQVSLDVRLWLREEIVATRADLCAFLKGLLELAGRYPDAVIPGYTHTRRAQAVLWPHYILAYFEMFTRDNDRLVEAYRRTNLMPLGSGALAGSGFPFDREALARELGFDGITRNSMDVSADRDFMLDFLNAASTIMLHLSRLAEDWILYSSEEYGWMELGDEVTSGSSLMPQKKNPDSLELIRGKCGRVFGCQSALFLTMKGLPLTYNRDMQEDKEPLFEAVDQTRASLEMARVVAESASLKPEVAYAACERSWVVATDMAEALARSGTPFHQAHQIVGKLVLDSVTTGERPKDLEPKLARLLDPREGMRTREIFGGTGPETVARALAEAERRLSRMSP